jgi:hypothetical protein
MIPALRGMRLRGRGYLARSWLLAQQSHITMPSPSRPLARDHGLKSRPIWPVGWLVSRADGGLQDGALFAGSGVQIRTVRFRLRRPARPGTVTGTRRTRQHAPQERPTGWATLVRTQHLPPRKAPGQASCEVPLAGNRRGNVSSVAEQWLGGSLGGGGAASGAGSDVGLLAVRAVFRTAGCHARCPEQSGHLVNGRANRL